VQLHRRTGKLRQNQHARVASGFFGGDKFLGHQVQAVAQRRDPGHVAGGVVRHHVLERQRAVEIAHGSPFERGKAAVDAAHNAVHLGAQGFVDFHARRGRGDDVEQGHAADQLRVLLQQALEGLQFFQRPLDVVEPLDRDNALGAVKQGVDAGDLFLHRRLGDDVIDQARVNAHRVRAQPDAPPADINGRGHAVHAQGAAVGDEARRAGHGLEHLHGGVRAHRVDKILDIARDVKADVIALQQAADDLAVPRQDVEDVARRKSRVVKKCNAQIGPQRAQKGRHHPQVVVMDPDHRALGRLACGLLGKDAVDFQKTFPVRLVELGLVGERKDDRPESFLGKLLVKGVDVFGGQGDARHLEIGVMFFVHRHMAHKALGVAAVLHRPGHP